MDPQSQMIDTDGGTYVHGEVKIGGNFIGRDQLNITMAKDALVIIQQFLPGTKPTTEEMVEVGTNGYAAVKLIKHGNYLNSYLLDKVKKEEAPQSETDTASIKNVAILVDINQRMLLGVAAYLDKKGIDAEIIIVTNDPQYSATTYFLDINNPASWEEIVHDFGAAIGIVSRYMGEVCFHIFLSTPLPLAFGLGSIWGTVREAMVYHYDKQTYHPVMKISRDLR